MFHLLDENAINAIEITNPLIPVNQDPYTINDSYYSKNLFGEKGSETWNYRFGYIQLNCFIPKPAILRLLLSFPAFKTAYNKNDALIITENGLYTRSNFNEKSSVIFQEEFYNLANKQTLITFLRHLATLKNKAAIALGQYLEQYKPEMLITDKFLVIPPGLRNYIKQGNKIIYPDILHAIDAVQQANTRYRTDNTQYREVIAAYVIYTDKLMEKVGKKEGMLRQKLASKIVNTTTRSVLTPNNELGPNEIGIPLVSLLNMYMAELAYALTKRKKEFEEVVHQIKPNATVKPESITWLSGFIKVLSNNIDVDRYKPIVEFIRKVLEEDVLPDAVVIFKRDPVIHKTSWLAAKPKIARSNALEINNLYTEPLGGDYDGDSFSGNVFLRVKYKDKWYRFDNLPASSIPFMSIDDEEQQ